MQRENSIDLLHRKELLKFLLVKTAVVRRGVKPAELLRIRHCYEGVNSEGLRVCLYRRDIYETLGLDYVELKVEAGGSLVLFYTPPVLAATLAEPRNRRFFFRCPACRSPISLLGCPRQPGLPHPPPGFSILSASALENATGRPEPCARHHPRLSRLCEAEEHAAAIESRQFDFDGA